MNPDQPRVSSGPAAGQFGMIARREATVGFDRFPAPVLVCDAWGDLAEVTPGLLDDEAQWVYRNGQCLALAVAVAERQGWPVVIHAIKSASDAGHAGWVVRHAYAQAPDGILVDSFGGNDRDVIEVEEGEEFLPMEAAGARAFERCLPVQDYATAATFIAAVLDLVD